MTKNEIVARWMGYKYFTWQEVKGYGEAGWKKNIYGNSKVPNTFLCRTSKDLKYDKSYDWLHEAWVKFRDLKFEPTDSNHNDFNRKCFFNGYCANICNAITHGTITEAFDELVKGIEWYNSLNK